MTPATELERELQLAFALADLAAEVTLGRFDRRDYEATVKPDGSVVTDVDVAVERLLRERLSRERPGQGLIGEELGRSGEAEWVWYLDPVDGTKWFIEGSTRWMTLIALAHRDDPVLAVLDMPAECTRWWAVRGGGAFRDGNRLSVSSTAQLADATVSDDWQQSLARGGREPALARVAARARRTVPNDHDDFLAVAGGEVDVAICPLGYPWDFAPCVVLVEEAGGRTTDLAGERRIDSGNLVASNGLIHDEVLAVARGRPPFAP